MKLAEALLERRDLQNKLLGLKNTMISQSLIEEGDKLEVSMDELLKEYHIVNVQLEKIIVGIHEKNQTVIVLETKETLQATLEKREGYRREYDVYQQIISTQQDQRRFARNEIKMVPSFSQKELTEKLNELAKKIRQVDALIQQTNWREDF